MSKLLADEGAERAGGETRGPQTVSEFLALTLEQQRADIALFWQKLAALDNNINRIDSNDPANRQSTIEDESIGE